MTEEKWLKIPRPHDLFRVVVGQQKGSKRSHRRKCILLGCDCCRRVWHHLDETLQRVIDLAERDADKLGFTSELRTASRAAFTWRNSQQPGRELRDLYNAVMATCQADVPNFLSCLTSWRVLDSGFGDKERKEFIAAETAAQLATIRDIFGNPFRPVSFDSEWRTSTAVALAKQMYESRDFSTMPILADALQDAGCDNEHILCHCRDPEGVHVRGCWVVDLVRSVD